MIDLFLIRSLSPVFPSLFFTLSKEKKIIPSRGSGQAPICLLLLNIDIPCNLTYVSLPLFFFKNMISWFIDHNGCPFINYSAKAWNHYHFMYIYNRYYMFFSLKDIAKAANNRLLPAEEKKSNSGSGVWVPLYCSKIQKWDQRSCRSLGKP